MSKITFLDLDQIAGEAHLPPNPLSLRGRLHWASAPEPEDAPLAPVMETDQSALQIMMIPEPLVSRTLWISSYWCDTAVALLVLASGAVAMYLLSWVGQP